MPKSATSRVVARRSRLHIHEQFVEGLRTWLRTPAGLFAERRSTSPPNATAAPQTEIISMLWRRLRVNQTRLTRRRSFFCYNLCVIHHNWIEFYTRAAELSVRVPSRLI